MWKTSAEHRLRTAVEQRSEHSEHLVRRRGESSNALSKEKDTEEFLQPELIHNLSNYSIYCQNNFHRFMILQYI